MSKVEQMESELRKLSQSELRQIREWLDDLIEDELEFTPEFEHSIQQAERDMADGKSARVREPEHAWAGATRVDGNAARVAGMSAGARVINARGDGGTNRKFFAFDAVFLKLRRVLR